jgi:hypothetical protein
VGPVQGAANLPPAWDELSCLPRPVPAAFYPSPPCMCACTCLFFLSSIFSGGEWWWVSVAAVYGWQLWIYTVPFLWIVLAVAGITAMLREYGRTGQRPCACVHLFVFLPLFVGVELGHVCGCKFLWVPLPLPVPSSQFKFGVEQGA